MFTSTNIDDVIPLVVPAHNLAQKQAFSLGDE